MATRYAIPDEPHPGPLERWAVDPVWPLFAQMLGGSWLALPWFVFNGLALGSATRQRELWLAFASLAGSALLVAMLPLLISQLQPDRTGVRLLLLPILLVKLGVAYALYVQQARSFELWRHYGGQPRNGLLLVVAAVFVESALFASVVTWWPARLVLE